MTHSANIPCILMRGGTSKGPYFNAADLPKDREELGHILIRAIGAGHPINIDGVGGGSAITTKVAILSKSEDDWADIDYFFGQVAVEDKRVDFTPTCGNILSGVGPAAIEMGLHPAMAPETTVRIRSVNTGAYVEAIVQTPNGKVRYDGETSISGVPGTAAPIVLNFQNVIGSKTGTLFPTALHKQVICGTNVTCIDVAMPMVIGKATDFGISGYESAQELDRNKDMFETIEAVRLEAGQLMGLGDVSSSVVPKFGLLAAPKDGGSVAARYFMPWAAHPSYAVTGSICTGACCLVPGTIAEDLPGLKPEIVGTQTQISIEHPSGKLDVVFEYSADETGFDIQSAGLLRTARKLFSGHIHLE